MSERLPDVPLLELQKLVRKMATIGELSCEGGEGSLGAIVYLNLFF